jgi:CCR4-NOT transcription complex subunit 7/8
MEIRNVWTENLEEELANIRRLTDKYTYVAMVRTAIFSLMWILHSRILPCRVLQDTEFPGVVAKPLGNHADYHYQTLRCNVDLLKIIQLGITFAGPLH